MSLSRLKNLKLLYVEDEIEIRESAMPYFNRLFGEVFLASNARDGLELFYSHTPDIVITDIKMPGMSGLEMVREIRQLNKNCQIIIMSAHTDTEFLLDAVELNLTKYIVKPASPEKLRSAFNQCLNNLKEDGLLKHIISEDSYFDLINRRLVCGGSDINLTKIELTLLEVLCKENDRIVTYEEIENALSCNSCVSSNAIRSAVKKLRSKLPKNVIKNHYDIGYQLQKI